MENKGKGITYSTGEVVEMLSVTASSLKYWDNFFGFNLDRDSSGGRIYSEKDIYILETVIDLRKKELSLKGIKEILTEKGLIDPRHDKKVIILEDNALAFKDFLTETIKEATKEGLEDISKQIEEMAKENHLLKEEYLKEKEESLEIKKELIELKEELKGINEKGSLPWWKKLF